MIKSIKQILLITSLSGLAACVSTPSGPGVLVLPGTNKSFDQFRADDFNCRQFATGQVGGETPSHVANSSAVDSAILGAAVGAAAGAAIAGGSGAAVGAGSGLAVGSIAGSYGAGSSYYEMQQRYDWSYIQCMYAQGHRVPVSGQISNEVNSTVTTMPNANIPPPPPGYPPPPPTR